MTVFRKDRVDGVVDPKLASFALPARRPPRQPFAVKVVLILVAINVLVAAMLLLKLRAPHLG